MSASQTRPRNVRVFISSTFRDMHAEREELVKHVFPQLRNFCEQRRVILSEVDLRWGILQEEIDAGKLLPICLAEVENCRPFFVCLLGDRYGTVISRIPEELLQIESWLEEHARKSITELEILHGALNKSAAPVHAFFYLRCPAQTDAAADAALCQSIEVENAESKSKLDDLRKRILNSGLPVREYTTPSQAGTLLLDDLKALLQQLFPEELLPDPLEQEKAAHEAFAESRSRVYIGLQYYFDQVDAHVASRQPPLIVTGEAGAGKSSLLANWARHRLGYPVQLKPSATLLDRLRGKFHRLSKSLSGGDNTPDSLLLTHFVGASAESTNRDAMLRRIMQDMRTHFNLQLDIPDHSHALSMAFANYLQAIAGRGLVILILDGLDYLSDSKHTSAMTWLPTEIPTNVRLILAATRGSGAEQEWRKRGWSVMEIKPLLVTEREFFITNYLNQYRKKLDPLLLKRVTSVEHTANPLYLRTVLEELRVFGRGSGEVAGLVTKLLAAQSTDDLFEKILIRLEEDYLSPIPYRPGLVRNTMRLLWAARQGLSETELTTLLGTAEIPLPSALWSPFYLAIKESLLNRSGLLSFFHQDLRRAVERRYLSDDAEKLAVHRELADYFTRNDSLQRRITELPWHLAAIGAWSELASLLADPDFLSAAWGTHEFEVKTYWSMIEAHSSLKMLDAYRPVIDTPTRYKNCISAVCALLSDVGHVTDALKLSVYLEQSARASGDLAALQVSLSLRAVLLKRRGDFDYALKLLKEQEQICRQMENWTALAASLGNQSVILRELGQLDAALSMHRQEEAICRRLLDLVGLGASLGNQGIILQEKGDRASALKLLREQEKICRQISDLAGLQRSLGNQGLILWDEGKTDDALKLLKADEELCRRLGDHAALHVCLGNQASILSSVGDYDRALELYQEKENICREIGDMAGLAHGLWLQSRLFAEKLRQPDFALPIAQEAQRIATTNGLTQIVQEIERFIFLVRQQGNRPM